MFHFFSIGKGPLGKATSKLKFLCLVLRGECDINEYFEQFISIFYGIGSDLEAEILISHRHLISHAL